MLGAAGALAIVATAALLTRAGGPVTAALRACGVTSSATRPISSITPLRTSAVRRAAIGRKKAR
jgi:hypothetical protein